MSCIKAKKMIDDAVAQLVTAGYSDTAISLLKIKLMELGETRIMIESLAPEIDRSGSGLQLRMF